MDIAYNPNETDRISTINTIFENLVKPFISQSEVLTTRKGKTYENIVGRGENAGNQHFLLFSQCFLSHQRQKIKFK